jgi:hypothetical protein
VSGIAKRVLQSKYCLFVPASLMYFYCDIPFQTFIKDTPKTATSSETRLYIVEGSEHEDRCLYAGVMGVSERLLFNVNMSNSSAISWRDRLQFVEPMKMAVYTKRSRFA